MVLARRTYKLTRTHSLSKACSCRPLLSCQCRDAKKVLQTLMRGIFAIWKALQCTDPQEERQRCVWPPRHFTTGDLCMMESFFQARRERRCIIFRSCPMPVQLPRGAPMRNTSLHIYLTTSGDTPIESSQIETLQNGRVAPDPTIHVEPKLLLVEPVCTRNMSVDTSCHQSHKCACLCIA